MKGNTFFSLFVVIAAANLLLAACDKNGAEDVNAPVLTLSKAAITASCEGGTYSFTCSITNAADDGELYFDTDADWISDISFSSGKVSFTVTQNTLEQTRGSYIDVSYVTSYSSVSDRVIVTQNSALTPVLTLETTSVVVSDEGGTFSLAYTVTNADTDGEVSCSADVDWIGDIDWSAVGVVEFTVEQNWDAVFRTGSITLSYSYSNGIVSAEVAVVQDHTSVGTIDYSDFIGVYTATGEEINDDTGMFDAVTWTMTVYANADDPSTVLIDGITPYVSGHYFPDSEDSSPVGVVKGYFNSTGEFIVPSQFNGYYMTTWFYPVYYGFTPCVDYNPTGDYEFYLSYSAPSCTFVYDEETDSWTSDYGMIIALYYTFGDYSSYMGYYDVTAPGVTIKKTSESASSVSSNEVKPLSEKEPLQHGIAVK